MTWASTRAHTAWVRSSGPSMAVDPDAVCDVAPSGSMTGAYEVRTEVWVPRTWSRLLLCRDRRVVHDLLQLAPARTAHTAASTLTSRCRRPRRLRVR